MCDHNSSTPCSLNPSHYEETFATAVEPIVAELINTGTTTSKLAIKVSGYDHIWKIHWERSPGSGLGCCVTVVQCLPGQGIWPMCIKSGHTYFIPNYKSN